MNIFKRFSTLLICLMIVFMPVLNGFTSYVYADNVPVGYTQVDSPNELTNAFLAYCKSRDTNIVGGGANIVANFTYSMILDASNALGINLTELQAELYYKQDSNQGIQWFMTSTGINAFNQIFARLITEKGLSVGDNNVNANLFNGRYYVDKNGHSAFVWVISQTYSYYNKTTDDEVNYIVTRGTQYKYTNRQIVSLLANSTQVNLQFGNSNMPAYRSGNYYGFSSGPSTNEPQYLIHIENAAQNASYQHADGFPIVYVTTSSSRLMIGRYSHTWGSKYAGRISSFGYVNNSDVESDINVNINLVTINNNPIKNEYEGDTNINNEGDIIINNGDDDDDDEEPINYNPYPDNPNYDPSHPDSGTTTSPSSGNGGGSSDGTINFPNIDFNLPEINWSLGDLSNKFPFSIPFDLVQLVTVLDAPAEAPRFEGTVNFGFTTWDYDINLESFDTVASVCRTTELVLFVFGLILITRNLIKG